jgi:hypothetical protein
VFQYLPRVSLISSLIPGVREVRAPLVSGYLWGVCLWLVIASHVPDEHSHAAYEHLVELFCAIGHFGQAIAASIGAYLLGSLIHSLASSVWTRLDSWLRPLGSGGFEEPSRLESSGGEGSFENLLQFVQPYGYNWYAAPSTIGGPSSFRTIRELSDRELGESFRAIERAIEAAKVRERLPSVSFLNAGGSVMVRLRVEKERGVVEPEEFVVPHLFLVRDLLDQRSLLETRLLEVAPGTGGQIERLRSEAEFRVAIALPLVVLAGILAVDVGLLWLVGLIVPFALLTQGRVLSRQASRELFDALRSRIQTPELERITPAYARYRASASRLVDGIERAR